MRFPAALDRLTFVTGKPPQRVNEIKVDTPSWSLDVRLGEPGEYRIYFVNGSAKSEGAPQKSLGQGRLNGEAITRLPVLRSCRLLGSLSRQLHLIFRSISVIPKHSKISAVTFFLCACQTQESRFFF